jgi:hypothetical protein
MPWSASTSVPPFRPPRDGILRDRRQADRRGALAEMYTARVAVFSYVLQELRLCSPVTHQQQHVDVSLRYTLLVNDCFWARHGRKQDLNIVKSCTPHIILGGR